MIPETCQDLIQTFRQKYPALGGHESLLISALTHRSVDGVTHNERLEFLGDAVLGLAVAEWLMETKPDSPEGHLSRYRSQLVNESSLAKWAGQIGITQALLLGRGEEMSGGRQKTRLTSGAVEAWLGALFLILGYSQVKDFIRQWLASQDGLVVNEDYKTQLQEHTQQVFGKIPEYTLQDVSGPDHQREYTTAVSIVGTELRATGTGKSKKLSEQAAASALIAVINQSVPQASEEPSWEQQ